ncbi:DNA-binding protein [Streptomyces sp. NPDC013489]|uniref:DNA-binding protein n=1 Tax=Streptomyces sp. NPDC013489 TaxID=3155606 RepID=UPI0033D0232E
MPWLVAAEDAAYYAGRPVGTIWRWASEGRLPKVGTGKKALYDVSFLHRAVRDEWTRELITPGDTPPMPTGAKAA